MMGSAWAFSAHAGRCIKDSGSVILIEEEVLRRRGSRYTRAGGWRMTGSAPKFTEEAGRYMCFASWKEVLIEEGVWGRRGGRE